MSYKPKLLAVAEGGTGLATLTNHGVLVGAATGNVTPLAAGTAGQVLQSGGASADPAWAAPGFNLGFFVYVNSNISNVTGDGTVYSILFDTTVFDLGSNITLNSAGKTIFTANATGYYWINFCCGYNGIAAGHNAGNVIIQGPGGIFTNTFTGNVGAMRDVNGALSTMTSGLFYMSTNDTLAFELVVYSSTKVVSIVGNSSGTSTYTYITGYRVF